MILEKKGSLTAEMMANKKMILSKIAEECNLLEKTGFILKEIRINADLQSDICMEMFEKQIEQKSGFVKHPLDMLKTFEGIPVVSDQNTESYIIKYEKIEQRDPRANSKLHDNIYGKKGG